MNEVAVLGGGCFWCMEAVFKMLKGVISVRPGYAGGEMPDPTYADVCTGTTGHAEVVRIVFDSSVISYRDLLAVFFATHDPTTRDRQGDDIGTQYRSIIFYSGPKQEKEAEEFIAKLNAGRADGDPVVTEVVPLVKFYEAEQEHKDYYARNSAQGYCQVVINPKLQKVQKDFSELLKESTK